MRPSTQTSCGDNTMGSDPIVKKFHPPRQFRRELSNHLSSFHSQLKPSIVQTFSSPSSLNQFSQPMFLNPSSLCFLHSHLHPPPRQSRIPLATTSRLGQNDSSSLVSSSGAIEMPALTNVSCVQSDMHGSIVRNLFIAPEQLDVSSL